MTATAPPPTATPAAVHGRQLARRTALTALAPAVWGTTYVVTTELLPAGHPLFAALMRALPAGILAILITRTPPRGDWWWKAAVLGTLNIGIFFALLFVTAERLPGGVAATLGATQPILVAFLVVAVLHERLSRWRLAWGVVGVIGVGLVVLGPGAGLDVVGVLAGVGGALSMGLGVVLTKRWGRPAGVSALGLAGWQLTAGGLVLLVPTLVLEGVPARVDGGAVAGYLWLGLVGGLLAYSVWFAGIRVLPVTATALLGLLSPLVATGLGAVVLGERFTAVQSLGLLLALAAMLAGQLAPQRRRTSTPPREPRSAE
ncbi:probable blue pigment (indigoidine) exporter [Paraoerskovia marina]|uniref:Probable blue pigment (Indigoidine) exporter n=1 Tax=Paraoerskovia marina TaxID=545619 RepID=A0A1H1PK90_9CELL|nr:EamA family transporter [Paraoerskovia marina]SDS11648.1 probable blue pigment (indigoidine) exporter [Paraoerskovia marina]